MLLFPALLMFLPTIREEDGHAESVKSATAYMGSGQLHHAVKVIKKFERKGGRLNGSKEA